MEDRLQSREHWIGPSLREALSALALATTLAASAAVFTREVQVRGPEQLTLLLAKQA